MKSYSYIDVIYRCNNGVQNRAGPTQFGIYIKINHMPYGMRSTGSVLTPPSDFLLLTNSPSE